MLSLVFGPFYGLAFMSQWGEYRRFRNARRLGAPSPFFIPRKKVEFSSKEWSLPGYLDPMETIAMCLMVIRAHFLVEIGLTYLLKSQWSLCSRLIPKVRKSTNRCVLFSLPTWNTLLRCQKPFTRIVCHYWPVNFQSRIKGRGLMEHGDRDFTVRGVWTSKIVAHAALETLCSLHLNSRADASWGDL